MPKVKKAKITESERALLTKVATAVWQTIHMDIDVESLEGDNIAVLEACFDANMPDMYADPADAKTCEEIFDRLGFDEVSLALNDTLRLI